jgi:hypothetical protein
MEQMKLFMFVGLTSLCFNAQAKEDLFLCEPSATGGVDYYSESGWEGKLHPIHSYEGGIEQVRYSVKKTNSGYSWKQLSWDYSLELFPYESGSKVGAYFGLTSQGVFEFNPERKQFTRTDTGLAIVRKMESEYSNLSTLYVQIGKCFSL